jgi:sec-independent protein translocase protein TatA
MRLGPWEIVTVLSVALLIFGPTKLPMLGKGLADFLKNFKSGMKDVEKEVAEVKDQLKT